MASQVVSHRLIVQAHGNVQTSRVVYGSRMAGGNLGEWLPNDANFIW